MEQATLVGMIAVAVNTAYEIAGMFMGDHWGLNANESKMMAGSIDKALNTLPEKYYAAIRANLEQTVPWIALAVTAAVITYPRIEATRRRARTEVETSSVGNGQAVYGPSVIDDFPSSLDPSIGNPL